MSARPKTILDVAWEGLTHEAPACPFDDPSPHAEPAPFEPFPVESLPPAMAEYVRSSAEALNVDPAFVAVSLLAILAGTIGNRFVLELSPEWHAVSVLWVAVVARSGSAKSPALDKAMRPLLLALGRVEAAYKRDRARYDSDLAAWRKGGEEPDCKPDEPRRPRLVIDDATAEAVALMLDGNPAGLLMVKDELSGWLVSFEKYGRGKGGSEPFYLSCHGARSVKVDRKGTDPTKRPPPIDIERAALSIVGCLTPGVRDQLVTQAHILSGLHARLVVVDLPSPAADTWARPRPEVPTADMEAIFDAILRERYDPSRGPRRYRLAEDAVPAWGAWFDEIERETADEPDEGMQSSLAKLKEFAARVALVLQVAADAAGPFGFDKRVVTADTMRRAVLVAGWVKRQARLSYEALTAAAKAAEDESLAAWVRRFPGGVTARQLQHNQGSKYRKKTAAKAALERLAPLGIRRFDKPTGPEGGRPTEVYRAE